jgi:hypothetical protein
MRSVGALTAAIALTLTTTASMQTTSALKDAATAIGAADVKTLEFTGSGRMFTVGQPPSAHEPWPPVELRSYTASIDYASGSMRIEMLRFMGPVMPRGGGAPFTGEQRQVQFVSGNSAAEAPRRRSRPRRLFRSGCSCSGRRRTASSKPPWTTTRRAAQPAAAPK